MHLILFALMVFSGPQNEIELRQALLNANHTGEVVVENAMTLTDTLHVPSGVTLKIKKGLYAPADFTKPLVIIGGDGHNNGRNRLTGRHELRLFHLRRTEHRVVDLATCPTGYASGVVFLNTYATMADVIAVNNFEIGVAFVGEPHNGALRGNSYNQIFLGMANDNQVALTFHGKVNGFVNENKIYGGNVISTGLGLQRIGAAFVGVDNRYASSRNFLVETSFELKFPSEEDLNFSSLVFINGKVNQVKARIEGPRMIGWADDDSFANVIEYGSNPDYGQANAPYFKDNNQNVVKNVTNPFAQRGALLADLSESTGAPAYVWSLKITHQRQLVLETEQQANITFRIETGTPGTLAPATDCHLREGLRYTCLYVGSDITGDIADLFNHIGVSRGLLPIILDNDVTAIEVISPVPFRVYTQGGRFEGD